MDRQNEHHFSSEAFNRACVSRRQRWVGGIVLVAMAMIIPCHGWAADTVPVIGVEGQIKKPFSLTAEPAQAQPSANSGQKPDALDIANRALAEIEGGRAAPAPSVADSGFVTGRAMTPKSLQPAGQMKKELLNSQFGAASEPVLTVAETPVAVMPDKAVPEASVVVAPMSNPVSNPVSSPVVDAVPAVPEKTVAQRVSKHKRAPVEAVSAPKQEPDAAMDVVITLPNGRAPTEQPVADGQAAADAGVADGATSRPSQLALVDAADVEPKLADDPATAEPVSKAVFNALESHPLIKGRKATAQARDHEVRAERSAYYPLVSVDAYTGWHDTENDATRSAVSGDDSVDRWESEGELRMRQLVWDFGTTNSRVDAAKSREAEAGADIQDGQEEIALRASEAYLDVLRALENLALARANVEKHEKTLRDVQLKESAGDGGDVAQTESRLALARSFKVQYEETLENARANFREAIGYVPAELTRPVLPDIQVPASIDDAITDAYRFNNGLRSASYRVEAFEHDTDAEYERMFPRVDVDVSHSRGEDVETFGGTSQDTRALLRMSWDFPTGGEKFARRDRASNLRLAASERLRERQRQVEEQVRVSYNNLQKTGEKLVPLKERVAAAETVVDAYKQQFEAGRRTLLDTLDSENERFLARVALNDGDYEYLRAHYRLFAAAGRLREALGITR